MRSPRFPRPKPAELLLAAVITGVLLFAIFWAILGHTPPLPFLAGGWAVVMAIVLAGAFARKPGDSQDPEAD